MATESRAHELKTEGALEAARDPHSSVTAHQAEKTAVDEARAGGSAAFQFDPDASPEEKRAQARARVPPGFHHERNKNATALVSDADDSGAPLKYDLPTPTKAGAIAPPTENGDKANGHAPELDEDARWERVGWAPRFGMPGSEDKEQDDGTMLDHQTWLEGRIEDKFYGDWYHNTGVIIFACLSTWVIGVLGGGLGWVMIIMAVCGTYYRTSIRRVRRNARDDLNREMAKNKLETDTESLEWINSFLVKFWPIYAPVLCDTIVGTVDQVLSTSTPAFLDSLKMKTFVLGTKPPRLEHVKTYPKTQDDIVLMDWKFSFTPNDTADLTSRQIKNKINPKIVLEIRIGKGLVSKGLDVIVEDMAFSGMMRLKFKLQLPFPHIEKVEMCFLERPTIDYVCKPLGGETFGFDINFIPGLESFIQEQIHANRGPMMSSPLRLRKCLQATQWIKPLVFFRFTSTVRKVSRIPTSFLEPPILMRRCLSTTAPYWQRRRLFTRMPTHAGTRLSTSLLLRSRTRSPSIFSTTMISAKTRSLALQLLRSSSLRRILTTRTYTSKSCLEADHAVSSRLMFVSSPS
jgi:hypothetical protein